MQHPGQSTMQTSIRSYQLANISYRLHYRSATASSKYTASRGIRGECGDLISFLAVAHCHALDISTITWQLPLGAIGEGGTAQVNQSTLNLKWSLAFKRPVDIDQSSELSQVYRVLMSEIRALCHAATRNHPNIVTLEGVCWDFHPKTWDAWPVFIFEKAQQGNLGDFMASEVGRAMNFPQRLQLCQDISVALTNLHQYAIIHGDINPRNILVFKDREHYYAKLSDFGYSALMTKDDRIDLAKTRPWNAPECDNIWLFDFGGAKKTDVYSFGVVCLWILFHENFHDVILQPEDSKAYNYRWIAQLRKAGGLKAFATSQIQAMTELSPLRRAGLQRFFDLSLAEDPARRDLFSEDLFHDYQQYGGKIDEEAPEFVRENLRTKFYDPPKLPYAALFQLSKIWYQTMLGDFRLWRSIFKGLETQAKSHPNQRCQSNATFQLAFCYQVGFGCDRCESESLYWLGKSGRCAKDLEYELKSIQANKGPWHHGITRDLGGQHLEDVYKASGILMEAEKVYKQVILDLACILSKDHDIMIKQKVQLAAILNEEGRFPEAEALLLATLASPTKHQSSFPVMRALVDTYYFMGRFKEMEASVLEAKALWDRAKYKSTTAFYNVNAVEEEVFLGHLAIAYYYQGKYKEAEATVMQRVELAKEEYGEADRRTLAGMADLAAIHIAFDRMQHARRILYHAIPIAERILGKDDHNVLHMNMQLSQAFSTRREQKAAEMVVTRNLETCKRVLGDSHMTTLDTIGCLAMHFRLQGRRHEALELLEMSLEIKRESLGHDHWRTAEDMSLLANTYWSLARWEEGEMLKARAVELYVKTLGEHHRDTVFSVNRLAQFRRRRRLWAVVARIIPESIIMAAARLAESSYAWVQRTLYHYA